MNKIFKYGPLKCGENILEIPCAWLPLSIQEQAGEIFMWADVNTAAPIKSLKIDVKATGDLVPRNQYYMDTVVMRTGLVWHVYRIPDIAEVD